MLEPRRVAAKSIANYLAGKLGEKVGQRVGYQIKNDKKISRDTVLEIVTEGILTRRLQNDPDMEGTGLIIFDEFHERSLHGDLSLQLSLEIQQVVREDLKLLVMSATIDTAMISEYMGGAEVIKCPGRTFPISITHSTLGNQQLSGKVISALTSEIIGDSTGDILVFLPGQADISRCIDAAKTSIDDADCLFLPLYGGLSLAQQEQALLPDPDNKRRVVFTTNIAETSLTIEGVTVVIDSGLEKKLIYDPSSAMTRLETVYISKASATQRAGRAGRTQPGKCIRLWSEDRHRSFREFQAEEVLTADLSGFILELAQWGRFGFDDINWLTPPPRPHYESARSMLETLGMIYLDGKLTELGNKAVSISLQPRLAAMLLQADGLIERNLACDLAALLSDRDIFLSKKGIDITDRMLAIQDYRHDKKYALRSYPLKRAAIESLISNSNGFRRLLRQEGSVDRFSLADIQENIGKLLLHAFPDRLAKKRSNGGGRYQLSNGRGVFLFEDDSLYDTDWLVVADCDAQKKEGRIYSAVPIAFKSVCECLCDQVEEKDTFQLDASKKKIIGRTVVTYRALELKSTYITDIPADIFETSVRQVLKDHCFTLLNWTQKCEDWATRAQWLCSYIDDFPRISKQSLVESMDDWLFPYIPHVRSIADLKKIDLFELFSGLLSWEQQNRLKKEAPVEYVTPSGKSVSIVYDAQQGPTVSVQLQEMFGQIESPMIGGGKVAIRFELLSPARRPIQTTSDLGNFWRTSYFEVAKEMRGRYPKHRWPDKPLLEKPGRSMKAKH